MNKGARILMLALFGIWTGAAGVLAQCAFEHRYRFEERGNEWKWIVYAVLAVICFVGLVWNAMKLEEQK